MRRFEAQVRARPPEVSELTERVGEFLADAGVDMRAAHHVAMILDELLTNLATHAGVVDDPATVSISVEPKRVHVEFTDSGPPFDPRSTPEPDLSVPAEDREIGGLGLFLMRKIASDLYYRRDARHNCIQFNVPRN